MSLGYLCALGAFVCIGSYMVPVRYATAKGLVFLPFMGLGILSLDIIRWPSLVALGHYPKWFWAAFLSGFLWAIGQTLANIALEEVSLAKASVLFNCNSFINIALGLAVFHEATGLKSYLLLFVGGVLLFWGAWWVARISPPPAKEGNLKKGILFGLLAGFFWGIYFVPIQAIRILDPQVALTSSDAFNGLALGGTLPALFLFIFCKRKFWTYQNVGLGVLTALAWAVGMTCFLQAIQLLGLARAVPIVNASGLVYAFWSLFVFKEFSMSQWPKVLGGTLIVVIGVILMAISN